MENDHFISHVVTLSVMCVIGVVVWVQVLTAPSGLY